MTAPVPDINATQLRQLRHAAGQFGEDRFLPCTQLRQIDGWRAKTDAAMLGFFRSRNLVRGVKQSLRWNAAAIEADAAQAFVLFDQDHFLAQISGVKRGRV